MLPAFSPEEIDQLKRAAQMFEMILDTGAQSDEAYETLKDVYSKLAMPEEFKRVTVRFAEYLLARDDRDAGIAQFQELASRHPDETEWRERLAQLGVEPVTDEPVTDQPAADEPAPAEATSDESAHDEASAEAREGKPGQLAAQAQASVDREAAEAFHELKAIAKRDVAALPGSAESADIDRALDEAEQILNELDTPPAREPVEPASAGRSAASLDDTTPPAGGERSPIAAAQSSGSGSRASAEHVEAKVSLHTTTSLEKEFQRSLRLGEMLVEQGVITRENLDEALGVQREAGKQIGEVLIDLGYATETDVLNCLSLQAGVPYLPLELYEVQPELAQLVPGAFARQHRLLPVDTIANNVIITIAAPLSREVKAELAKLLGERRVSYYISAKSEIVKKLDELYPPGSDGVQ